MSSTVPKHRVAAAWAGLSEFIEDVGAAGLGRWGTLFVLVAGSLFIIVALAPSLSEVLLRSWIFLSVFAVLLAMAASFLYYNTESVWGIQDFIDRAILKERRMGRAAFESWRRVERPFAVHGICTFILSFMASIAAIVCFVAWSEVSWRPADEPRWFGFVTGGLLLASISIALVYVFAFLLRPEAVNNKAKVADSETVIRETGRSGSRSSFIRGAVVGLLAVLVLAGCGLTTAIVTLRVVDPAHQARVALAAATAFLTLTVVGNGLASSIGSVKLHTTDSNPWLTTSGTRSSNTCACGVTSLSAISFTAALAVWGAAQMKADGITVIGAANGTASDGVTPPEVLGLFAVMIIALGVGALSLAIELMADNVLPSDITLLSPTSPDALRFNRWSHCRTASKRMRLGCIGLAAACVATWWVLLDPAAAPPTSFLQGQVSLRGPLHIPWRFSQAHWPCQRVCVRHTFPEASSEA